MKKILIICFFLITPVIATDNSQQKDIIEDVIFCAYKTAKELEDIIESSAMRARDKFRHCAISCTVSLKCDVASTSILGIAKEIYDIFGPGSAEWGDLYANFIGVTLSRTSSVQTMEDCTAACTEYYPEY